MPHLHAFQKSLRRRVVSSLFVQAGQCTARVFVRPKLQQNSAFHQKRQKQFQERVLEASRRENRASSRKRLLSSMAAEVEAEAEDREPEMKEAATLEAEKLEEGHWESSGFCKPLRIENRSLCSLN